MRFHVGLSFRPKVILKWLGAIGLALLSFFGISQMEVLALENPSNCSDSSITDYMTCNIQGYYSITDDDISNACNIYLGDSSTLNWRTRQVAVQIDYDVKASEISTTYDSNLLSMQQISRENNGQVQSNFAFRFLRDEDDSPLYLSLTTYNMTSDTCQYIAGAITCPPPAITVYYCNSDTFNSCYHESWGYAQSFSNELIGDIRFTTYKNLSLKTNAQIKQEYHRSEDFNYIQINFPNMPNSDTLSPPSINSGWNYSGVLLSSHALTTDESPTDNQYITNYCSSTGGDYVNIGGTSVLDQTTQAILDMENNGIINGAIEQGDNFLDTQINNHGILDIVRAPITLLQGILNSSNYCQNLSFDVNIGSYTKQVSLPSGCIIWDRVPSVLETTYHVIVFGLLTYYLLTDVYKFVNDIHDPDKKNDYTLDL